MKYLSILVLLFSMGGLVLAGCGPSPVTPDSPLPTPGAGTDQLPESPLPTPVPPVAEDEFPTPSSPDLAVVTGVIMRDVYGEASDPLSGYTVYLGRVLYSDTGHPALVSVGDSSPRAVVAANGRFLFLDVLPDIYGLAIGTPLGEILYEPPEGGDFIFTLEPGQVLDLGELHTEIPY
ncbi:MAG: hypothetical protein JW900_00410 [Anaerolineae bacterium]|nr:hypothetical protein [Anaerolineae bacterium]